MLFNHTKSDVNFVKSSTCADNQSWDVNILNYNSYCISSFIALFNENSNTTLKWMYINDYLLFNHTKSDVTLYKKIPPCTYNQS